MDLSTVSGVVEALVATYTAGLEYYTKWQQRKWQGNQYKAHAKANPCGGNACALSTSLSFSSRKVREAFDGGVDILGDGFATGDEICRNTLQCDLERLQERIYTLYQEIRAKNSPLDLFEAVRTSESVRTSTLAALAGQYKRVAVGRLVPLVLPGSQQQSRLSVTIEDEEETVKPGDDDDRVYDDADGCAQVTYGTASSSRSPYLQSEPPSPPPTPKQIPDDTQSACASTMSGTRPRNSVFSMFCPEALKYQVNLQKTMPKRRNCKCGYDWNGVHTEDKTVMMVKEGFQITARFLGKSHCKGGFGCVLCTSSGRTETYSSVEDLKDHINASHTKWQLLHDRDMVGQ
ncbi:hypothetical protein F4781DRAFT_426605 [Annulohypoxylon bovei var. microspora]|nr:hypothetical protein F4781DRAFT_426605 [Annulohypoxylon bovei var. microspora]